MEKWIFRLCCGLALFNSAVRQFDNAMHSPSYSLFAFWCIGSIISIVLMVIVMVKGVA